MTLSYDQNSDKELAESKQDPETQLEKNNEEEEEERDWTGGQQHHLGRP